MTPTDIIVLTLIVLVIGGAVFYIVRAKRRGQHCIGCPDAKSCNGNCASCNSACANLSTGT